MVPQFTAVYEMAPIAEMLAEAGIQPDGPLQTQLTNIVNRRITRYMPYRTGALATKLKRIVDPETIEVSGPYARVMYYGKVMVDPVTGAAGFQLKDGTWRSRTQAPHVPKILSGRSIQYNHTFNPQAGPYWDRRLVAAERDAIVAELQAIINNGG